MKKLLIQLGFVFTLAILFTGCSKKGALPGEAEDEAFFDPLPQGLPVFTEIDEAFIADSLKGDGRSALFSYQLPETDAEASETKEVFSTDKRLMVSLNTVNDPERLGRSEVTLLVKNDSVYSINHVTNQIRLLSHFTHTVCELIPREWVDVVTVRTNQGIEKTLTVLHDELIYVMTAEGAASTACTGEGKKRFYALPLDHQLDPAQDEDGELNSLELVNESLARAKLIFGWVVDTDQQDTSLQKLTYGFLGYGAEEITSTTLKPALVLYNTERQEVWRQDRSIEKFPILETSPDVYNQPYLFHVQALENYHYLVQLGLDVFVVDAGEALLSKTFAQAADILSDRSLRLSPSISGLGTASQKEYAVPVTAYYDGDDLLVENQGKLFSYAYQANTAARNPSESYKNIQVIPQNQTSITSRSFAATRFFSQFDLKACGDDIACQTAHNVEAQSWQFLTPCTEALGCSLNNQVADFCETFEEKLVTQSDEPLCTASDYRHLSELNKAANDMRFKAFMQYRDYLRGVSLALENNRLYITARMNEKDLLLQYNYALDFSAPKSQREQVLFGKEFSLYGLDVRFVNSNLFMTALTKGAVRSNECYKDYVRVPCDLGELSSTGNSTCTGKDLADGLCTSQFQEYESRALFCSGTQLQSLSCSGNNLAEIDSLAIESSEQDAKWLSLYDYSSSTSNAYQVKLLVGNHVDALNADMLDEGRLLNPEVFSVDADTGQPTASMGVVQGPVEQAVHGWVVKEAEPLNTEVLAHLQLISEELLDGVLALKSELVNYLIEQSFADAGAPEPYTEKVQKVGVSHFERP